MSEYVKSTVTDGMIYGDRYAHVDPIINPCYFCRDAATQKLSVSVTGYRRSRSIMLCDQCVTALKNSK